LLDNDVDAQVGAMLRGEGHRCWSASDAGLASAADRELAIYAHDQRAALVSHDRRFSEWSVKNTIGKHLYLDVPQWDAESLLLSQLPKVCRLLESMDDVVAQLHRHSLVARTGWE